MSPSWLLRQVLGPVIEPHPRNPRPLVSDMGEVTMRSLRATFLAVFAPELVLQLLLTLRLCIEVRRSKLDHARGDRLLLVPSLLPPSPPQRMWGRDGAARVFAGRRVSLCVQSGMLLPESMYLRIQTRVHELFGDSMAVWKGGFDGLVGNVECFSRFEEEEAIDVWVRGPSGSEEAAWMVLYLVSSCCFICGVCVCVCVCSHSVH